MSESIVLTQEQREALLTERELAAYQLYARLRQPPMAASTQAQFFALFLNGDSCEEIVRLNPNGFPLGAVVRARVENDWDQKRREHQAQLMAKVREKVQQITLETVDALANRLAAENKLTNDRVKKYLQTGDVAELQGTGVGSLRNLKETIEMLQKLTGQDAPKKQSISVDHRHVVETTPTELPVIPAGRPVTPSSAATALDVILKNRQGKS